MSTAHAESAGRSCCRAAGWSRMPRQNPRLDGWSVQTDVLQRRPKQVVFVTDGHDHLGVEQAGDGESLPGKKIQPSAGAVELAGHHRCQFPPAQHLDVPGQFEDSVQGRLALRRWKRQDRSGESPASPADYGLTQA
jgi:hypothetical protein